jgi:anti-sigma B factor antagonist
VEIDARARYSTQFYTDVCVVSAQGEVDMAEAPLLRDAIRAGVDRGATHVVADLTDVSYLDSTGLGVLIGFTRELGDSGGQFIVVASDPQLLRLFEIAGLDGMLRVDHALEQAMVELMGRTDGS